MVNQDKRKELFKAMGEITEALDGYACIVQNDMAASGYDDHLKFLVENNKRGIELAKQALDEWVENIGKLYKNPKVSPEVAEE